MRCKICDEEYELQFISLQYFEPEDDICMKCEWEILEAIWEMEERDEQEKLEASVESHTENPQ